MLTPIASKLRSVLLSTIISGVVQYAQILILAHFMGPSAFGLITIIYLTYAFASLFVDCGMGAAIISFQLSDRDSFSTLFWLNLAAGGAIALLLFAAAPLLAAFFDSDRLGSLVRLVAVCPFILSFSLQYLSLLQKELRFGAIAAAEIAGKCTGMVVFAVLLLTTRGLDAPIWALLVDTAVRACILVLAGRRLTPVAPVFRPRIVARYYSYGAFQLGDRITNFLATRVDHILIGAFLTPEDLGYYSFAYTLVSQPHIRIGPVLKRLSIPLLARAQDAPPALKKTYLSVVDLLLTISVPLLMGITFLSPLYIPLFFGDKWTPSIPLVFVLGAAMTLMIHSSPSGALLLAIGKTGRSFALTALYFLTQIPAVAIAAKLHGPVGVASAILLLQLAFIGIEYKLVFRQVLGRCFREVYGLLFTPLLVSLPFVSVALVLLGTGNRAKLPVRFVAGCIGFVLSYGGVLLWYRRGHIAGVLGHLNAAMAGEGSR
jgi:O-antigen/teichoic acid export membrane protein